eukprot:6625635-Alexandrium_andersonii.AAC.1
MADRVRIDVQPERRQQREPQDPGAEPHHDALRPEAVLRARVGPDAEPRAEPRHHDVAPRARAELRAEPRREP